MSNNSIALPDNFDDIPKEFWDTYQQGEPYGIINIEMKIPVSHCSPMPSSQSQTSIEPPGVESSNICLVNDNPNPNMGIPGLPISSCCCHEQRRSWAAAG